MTTDLVSNWINYYESQDMSSRWASDQLDQLVKDEPDRAFDLMVQIAEQSEDDFVVTNLGAGPFEDLLVLHGPEFIDAVEQKVEQNPAFFRVVKCVLHHSINDAVWKRVCELQAKQL